MKFNERLEAARAAAEDALTRSWLINNVEVVGKFMDLSKNQVTLQRKDDGTQIEIGLSKLNKDDQKWVRDEMKVRRAKVDAEKEKARKAKKK